MRHIHVFLVLIVIFMRVVMSSSSNMLSSVMDAIDISLVYYYGPLVVRSIACTPVSVYNLFFNDIECSLFSIIEEHESALSQIESNYSKEINELK